MSRHLSGISATTLCLLAALATSASAEGAWTLWMMGASSPWDSVGTFPTREECVGALHQEAQAVEQLGLKVTEEFPADHSPARMPTGTCADSASPTP